MKNIKLKYNDLQWLKIGYCDWKYYKDRKIICYSGKIILFQWNPKIFNAFLTIQKSITASETF